MNNSVSFVQDTWYYALPANALAPGKMLAKTLLNEPVVFGRTNSGEVFALRDICPHRAVPLSCGIFNGQEVECCYHGWRFNAQGDCTIIPALAADQQVDLERYGVRKYHVRELQGNIWIYMPAAERPDAIPATEPPKVPGIDNDTCYQVIQMLPFPCYIDHAVVGLMDPAHVPFVHRSWWWRTDSVLNDEIKTFDPSHYGFTMRRHKLERSTFFYDLIGGTPEVEISFQLPGVRFEVITTEKHTVVNLTVITPISDEHTEVTSMFYTTLPWAVVLKPVILPFIRTFLDQDRQMVIKQQIGLKHDPVLMLIKDADAQARWYYQIKSEYAKSIAENRPFKNPVKEQVLHWRS
jgi:phenylpropionate dioxygenase-like ring-hydroxylating dioxygenase large terminal subunit